MKNIEAVWSLWSPLHQQNKKLFFAAETVPTLPETTQKNFGGDTITCCNSVGISLPSLVSDWHFYLFVYQLWTNNNRFWHNCWLLLWYQSRSTSVNARNRSKCEYPCTRTYNFVIVSHIHFINNILKQQKRMNNNKAEVLNLNKKMY